MKGTSIFTCCTVLLFFSCQQAENKQTENTPKPAFDEAAETAAIMQVIENETKCFFDGDYDCWTNNWSHEKYAMQAWNNDDGTYDAAIGWEAINTQGKEWIEKYYQGGKNIIHPFVKKETPQVKFFNENTAYLIWKQYNADKEKKYFRVSQETRIMEKQSDGWKIVNVTAFWDAKSKIPVDSLHLMGEQ
ncbi:MAG: hypothetical protein HUU34_14110 [Saprospiraceae bacterium]|nr:hypothetical protein [Saprospiraceae bacterium]